MLCPQCQSDIHFSHTECPECGFQLGYPNVRQAQDPQELQALDLRYQAARTGLAARNADSVGFQFEQEVNTNSRAVICRRWGTLATWLDHGNELFLTYYEQLESGKRRPQDNGFDTSRTAVDEVFFPYFKDHINFAALSLDGKGPASYGECHFSFKQIAIAHRTSVFEENTVVFTAKHRIVPTDRPPVGYTATWDARGRLALAKLADQLEHHSQSTDFPAILLVNRGGTDTDEFLECHIFGRLTISNIEQVKVSKPQSKEDKVLAARARRKLNSTGISVSEIP